MNIQNREYDVEMRMWSVGYSTSYEWEENKDLVKYLVKYTEDAKGDLVPLMAYEILGGIFSPTCRLLFKGKKLPLPQ